jgi:hypothetical protein
LTLEEPGMAVAVMGLDRCQAETPEVVFEVPGPEHSYSAEMEVTLGIWVNELLTGLPAA